MILTRLQVWELGTCVVVQAQMKGNEIVATCRANRVRLTLLGCLLTLSLSGFMAGQAFAQFLELVQAQSAADAPVSNQQCTLTFSNPIGSGDTVVGFVHSTNNADNNPMTPDAVTDNNNNTYVLAGAVQWNSFQEDINIFYLTNVQGNPTSLTFDFSNYPNSDNTVLGQGSCNVGFAEYSGVSSVVVAGPTPISGTSPSITISPTSFALIWLFAADFGGGFSSLQNSGIIFNGIIDNWSTDDIGVWSSILVPPGSLTLNVSAPFGNSNASVLAAVALQ